jgi:hypothetical protein
MSELRKMTRMGGDLRKIARLLQDKGRNGDTILAHINPREAALLREQGGSGDINPETGLPEFSDWSEKSSGYDVAPPEPDYSTVREGLFEGAAYIPEVEQIDMSGFRPGSGFAENASTGLGLTQGIYGQDISPVSTPTSLGLTRGLYGQDATGAEQEQKPAEKGFLDSLSGGDKLRLGLGLAGGLQTAYTARKARQGAQEASRRIAEIGKPYQQQGLAQQSAASRGELTPVNQQALDAMRARASQAGVARGGVGVAQQQRAEEDLRQRLLAAQQDFGLKLSGIGDQYTAAAIKEGIRADAEISAMYSNYYGNLTRLAAPSIVQSTQPPRGR